jgi:hypothetical protein
MPDLIKPQHLETIQHLAAGSPDAAVQRRAQLLLLYHTGHSTAAIAEKIGRSTNTALYWRRRYRAEGLGIFPNVEAPAVSPPAEDAAPDVPQEAPKDKKKPAKKAAKKKAKKTGKKAAKKKSKKKDNKKPAKKKKDKKSDKKKSKKKSKKSGNDKKTRNGKKRKT